MSTIQDYSARLRQLCNCSMCIAKSYANKTIQVLWPELFNLTIQTDINVFHLRNNAIHCEDVWPAPRSASVTWVGPYRFEHTGPLIKCIGSPAPRHSSCYSEPGESRSLNFLHGLVCLCGAGLLFRSSGDVSLIFHTVLKHLSLILMFSSPIFFSPL